jgi:hypothetical protein
MSGRVPIPDDPKAPGALGAHMLADARDQFRSQRKLAEAALEQVDDEAYFAQLDGESNSIAIVVKHIAGNLRSRWRDFLTTDGEKPDRHRDTEFEIGPIGTPEERAQQRAALDAAWREGWEILEQALAPLGPDDLLRTVTIRGEPHSVVQAIHRQISHYGNHVGQIVLLAKHARGAEWKTLSVPRGKSGAFEQTVRNRFGTEPR